MFSFVRDTPLHEARSRLWTGNPGLSGRAAAGQLQTLSRSEFPPDTSHSPGSFADAARVSLSGRRLTEEQMSP
jgi:hypothetical protein